MSSTNYRILDQSAISYYKTFVNLLNIQSNVYANNIMVRYSSNKIFKTLTYSQVDRITTNLACEWAKNVKDAGVISYINDSGVNYMLTMIALMKLRSVLFVISPRNSEAAVTELLKNTKSKTFFAAKKYEAVARSAASKLGDVNVIIIDPLNIESLLEQPLNDKYNNIIDSNFTENDIDKPALIIHRYIYFFLLKKKKTKIYLVLDLQTFLSLSLLVTGIYSMSLDVSSIITSITHTWM